jgi:hypothetical protein
VRPTITEQLDGLRRILQEVVAPEVTDPYPADILAGVCATLETLAAGWSEVPAFLAWDAQASLRVLAEVLAVEGPHLTEQVGLEARAVVEAPSPDTADFAALEAYHRRVRSALELAIPVITGRDELSETRTHLVVVLRERAERYPLKTVWRPSATVPAK